LGNFLACESNLKWFVFHFSVIEAYFIAGEDEATLHNGTKSFQINLSSMHEIREENGTARPVQVSELSES
jgi:hypothetical protein